MVYIFSDKCCFFHNFACTVIWQGSRKLEEYVCGGATEKWGGGGTAEAPRRMLCLLQRNSTGCRALNSFLLEKGECDFNEVGRYVRRISDNQSFKSRPATSVPTIAAAWTSD